MRDLNYSMSEQLIPAELRGYRSWLPHYSRKEICYFRPSKLVWGLGAELEWPASNIVTETIPFLTGTLTGRYKPYRWMDGVNTALCPFIDLEHQAPGIDCSCGFYALYSPWIEWPGEPIQTKVRGISPILLSPQGLIVGVIAASGKTVLGKIGFRAEKARIVAFTLPSTMMIVREDWSNFLADKLETPIDLYKATYPSARFYDSVQEMMTDYPPEDVSELIRE